MDDFRPILCAQPLGLPIFDRGEAKIALQRRVISRQRQIPSAELRKTLTPIACCRGPLLAARITPPRVLGKLQGFARLSQVVLRYHFKYSRHLFLYSRKVCLPPALVFPSGFAANSEFSRKSTASAWR